LYVLSSPKGIFSFTDQVMNLLCSMNMIQWCFFFLFIYAFVFLSFSFGRQKKERINLTQEKKEWNWYEQGSLVMLKTSFTSITNATINLALLFRPGVCLNVIWFKQYNKKQLLTV
jgi:hypothetical protein